MSAPVQQPAALPLQTRLAPIETDRIDVEARTIEVIWTTGATVRRRRWIGWDTSIPFDEELIVSADAIDLSRMQAGAPVLDSHSTWSTAAIRAVVDAASIVGGQGLATLRFPREGIRKESDELFELARDKVIRNISVGYAINQVRVIEPTKASEVERRIIEKWTPYEVSFVTVPADAGAQVRSGDTRTFPLDIVGREGPGIGEAAAARSRMLRRGRLSGLRV